MKNVESKTEHKDRLKGQETQPGERSRAGVLQNSYIRNEQKALNRNFFSRHLSQQCTTMQIVMTKETSFQEK